MQDRGGEAGRRAAGAGGVEDHEVIQAHRRAVPPEGRPRRSLREPRADLAPSSRPRASPTTCEGSQGGRGSSKAKKQTMTAIMEGKVKAGDAIIIRYEGPKGGPGMREMLTPTSVLCGRGLDLDCALITDGRFSGRHQGPLHRPRLAGSGGDGPHRIRQGGRQHRRSISTKSRSISWLPKRR